MTSGWKQLTRRLFRHFQLLKLKYDKLLSNFAFNCNLCHHSKVDITRALMNHTSGTWKDEAVAEEAAMLGK